MKNLTAIVLALFVPAFVLADARFYSVQIIPWNGSYTNEDLEKSSFASTARGLKFHVIYLDAACEAVSYSPLIDGNTITFERYDKPESCITTMRPHVLKGELFTLKPGTYQFKIVRKNALGTPREVFQKEILVGGKW